MSKHTYSIKLVSQASLPILVENTEEENYGYDYWMPPGTCFLLKGNKAHYIVTAYHVLQHQGLFDNDIINDICIYYYLGSRYFLPMNKIHYSENEPNNLNPEYDYNDLVLIEIPSSELRSVEFRKSCVISIDDSFEINKNMKFIFRGYPYQKQGIVDLKIKNQAIKIGGNNLETYQMGTYKIKITENEAKKHITEPIGLSGSPVFASTVSFSQGHLKFCGMLIRADLDKGEAVFIGLKLIKEYLKKIEGT